MNKQLLKKSNFGVKTESDIFNALKETRFAGLIPHQTSHKTS